ncbi:MAG: c-type cytochrome domain-containing protein [Bacteroidales bacterium]
MKLSRIYFLPLHFILAVACLNFISCRHELILPENIPEICFEHEVLPIFRNSCGITGCHDGSGEDDYILTDYLGISHSVISGKPYESPVYKAIIARTGEDRMPPDKPLSRESRMIIRLWIEQGARLTSCPDTTSRPSDFVNPRACFSRDILPVLVSSCAMTGCHDAATHEEGYIFAGYSTTMQAVRPGNPSESKLYEVITEPDGEDRMPPSPLPRLSSAQIDSIAAWIGYGALDEFCGEACDTINPVTYSATIRPAVNTYCTGCHSGTAPGGGVRLETYANVSSVAASGVLMNALRGNGVPKMPPAGSLSTCRIRQFELWINNGYPNN